MLWALAEKYVSKLTIRSSSSWSASLFFLCASCSSYTQRYLLEFGWLQKGGGGVTHAPYIDCFYLIGLISRSQLVWLEMNLFTLNNECLIWLRFCAAFSGRFSLDPGSFGACGSFGAFQWEEGRGQLHFYPRSDLFIRHYCLQNLLISGLFLFAQPFQYSFSHIFLAIQQSWADRSWRTTQITATMGKWGPHNQKLPPPPCGKATHVHQALRTSQSVSDTRELKGTKLAPCTKKIVYVEPLLLYAPSRNWCRGGRELIGTLAVPWQVPWYWLLW